jgi:hypothetical protein
VGAVEIAEDKHVWLPGGMTAMVLTSQKPWRRDTCVERYTESAQYGSVPLPGLKQKR